MQLFKKEYPETKCTEYKLRLLYKQCKIKNKRIQLDKIKDVPTQEKVMLQAVDLGQDVGLAIERGFRVVQI